MSSRVELWLTRYILKIQTWVFNTGEEEISIGGDAVQYVLLYCVFSTETPVAQLGFYSWMTIELVF